MRGRVEKGAGFLKGTSVELKGKNNWEKDL